MDLSMAMSSAGETDERMQESFVKAFRWMLMARVLDDKLASLYRGGKIQGGVFLGRGQEALSVASAYYLKKTDVFAPLIRDQAGRLAFGEDILDALRSFLGSALGPMKGRDGNVHRGRPREGLLAMISHLGSMISVVNGILMARRMKGITDTVGVASIGDGGTSTGAFHEAINQAAVEKLPLVLVVANNQYAYSTNNTRQFACHNLMDKAAGYGIQGWRVDGTDLKECLALMKDVVKRARSGQGPQLVVADLLRLCGHGEHDDCSYVDQNLASSKVGRDCIKVAEAFLEEQGWAKRPEIDSWRNEAIQKVEQTASQVNREPGPDPYQQDWVALSTRHLVESSSGTVNNPNLQTA